MKLEVRYGLSTEVAATVPFSIDVVNDIVNNSAESEEENNLKT